ncbi:GNAT family N-acetyltransferase [Paenibacillus albus]|uniref:GNAT family N-acetyltransferase n=1 Tax=Paenibacillus albus TaxID=2495582 RepID=A0A3S9A5Q2_9BACL|nr:GNAT family N-acetyltransferase [Paenibacillus albus]AZN41043.1 GNAT family N-acetyltransferase [Paenibacillus albus]
MIELIQIRQMTLDDIEMIHHDFNNHGIERDIDYILNCWEENESGTRITLLAFYKEELAGSLHLLSTSNYPPFIEQGIPEVNDFNVFEPVKRLGIGNRLMDEIEKIAIEKYGKVGIGVGMHFYYGPAQRLYAKRDMYLMAEESLITMKWSCHSRTFVQIMIWSFI